MLSFFTTFQPDLNALILSTVTMHSQTFSWEIDNVSIIGRDFFFQSHPHSCAALYKKIIIIHYIFSTLDMKEKETKTR